MGKELDLRKAVLQVAKNRADDERHQARLADQVTYSCPKPSKHQTGLMTSVTELGSRTR